MIMRNWPIRYKLLLLTVLPVVAVALAITVFWITMKLEDLTRALHERGRTLTEFIAPAAEYGVVSGNREHLAALTTGAREEPDLVRLVITDRDGLVLYHFDKRVSTDTDRTLTRWIATALSGDASLRFRRPIVLGTVEVAGERPEPVLGSRIVGDVTVTLSTWPTALRQAEWIIESILIAGSVLFLTILLTWWISRSLSAPLEQLAAIVTRFGRGILHERADTGVGGEIGVLEHGMNLMAERLESSHLRMEHEIRQATRGLLEQVHLIDGKNRELEQAWTLADEANRKKSLFLGNISHELRTPLNAIAGFIDLMEQDGRYGGDDARRLRILRDATSDLIELVNDLLDLTRIESGRIELRDEPFELAETLRNPIELLRNSHGTQGVDIVALVAADLPQRLRGDALRIKQVLFNLLSNAGKHSRNGAIVLDVQRQGNELRIAVEDDGDGIPASDLTRLFEPFVQLGEQPPRQSGTGLGLSITRSLVQLMGGRIEVDSQVGRGSCFTVYLPLNDGDDENSAAATTQPCVQDRPPAHVFADTERGRKHLFALARQVGLDVTVHADDAAYAQAMRGNERAVGLLHWWRPPARHATHVVAAVRDGRVRQIALLPVRGIDPTSQDMSCILHDVSALPDEVAASICGLFGVSDDDRTPAAPRTMPPPPRLCGLTFLVADDQEVNRMLLAEILRRNGARSVGAADGVEAVEAYRAQRPDIVLMDIHMPHLDGVAAARRIREFDPAARLVALTADVYRASEDVELELLFDAVVIKPIRERDILRLVCRDETIGDETIDDKPSPLSAVPTTRSDDTYLHDPTAAIELAGGNVGLARDMFEMLLAELSEVVRQIAGPELSSAELARIAHRLNGGARYCACTQLREAAAALERALREELHDETDAARRALLDAIGALQEYGERRRVSRSS